MQVVVWSVQPGQLRIIDDPGLQRAEIRMENDESCSGLGCAVWEQARNETEEPDVFITA